MTYTNLIYIYVS